MRKQMQIQLNQNEIEIALRNYVNGILQIQEGMDINITLKATRGDDGQTAIIDIVPAAPVKVEPVATASQVAVQRRPRQTTQVVIGDTKTADAAKDQPQGVSGSVGEVNTTKAVEGNEKQADAADSPTSSVVAATTGSADAATQAGDTAGEVPAATERKSLFSGLSRPVNS